MFGSCDELYGVSCTYRFVGPVLALLKAVLPSPLRDQLEICRSVTDIEKFIDISDIPTEYGGKSPYKLGESQEEKLIAKLIELNSVGTSA